MAAGFRDFLYWSGRPSVPQQHILLAELEGNFHMEYCSHNLRQKIVDVVIYSFYRSYFSNKPLLHGFSECLRTSMHATL